MARRYGRHLPALRVLRASRSRTHLADDQRNPQRRFVREETVRLLAVIPERLAVIGGHDRPALAAPTGVDRPAAARARRRSQPPRRRTDVRRYCVSNGGGGRYGACGSKTCSHTNHGCSPAPSDPPDPRDPDPTNPRDPPDSPAPRSAKAFALRLPAPPDPSALRAAIHERASGTTAEAGRSGMTNSVGVRVLPKRSS